MAGFWRRNGGSAEQMAAFRKWNQEEVDTSKEVVPPPSAILSECPKFRILVIGGTGVGKSTICKYVFGVHEKLTGVSHNKRGEHNIEEGLTFRGQNERIIIHDSKGFEGGEQETFNEVVRFIQKRRKATKLADQLHCIWYCISCENENRPLQASEEKFFQNLEGIVGKIPVIVVFTKYDELISKVYSKWHQQNRRKFARGEISEETMFNSIRTTADKQFQTIYAEQWAKVINRIRVPAVRIANPPETDDEDDDLRAICPDIGVESLTVMTLQNLENHDIKILWATAQNNSATVTSQQSIVAAMEYFSINQALNVIPLIPVLSAVAFWRNFTRCFSKISPLWNLIDDSKLLWQNSTRHQFIKAIFDTSSYGFIALHAADILGALDAPETAAILAKAIAGIILIHDNLFIMQKTRLGDNKPITPLTTAEIDRVLEDYRTGNLRKVITEKIDGSSLFTRCYSKQKITELIQEAIDLARSRYPRAPFTGGPLR